MKSLSSGYAVECAKKTGITPLWILKLTVGGTDYYLGDNALAIPTWQGGVSVLPWVTSWGQFSEGITGELGEIRVADIIIETIIDPDATPNMDTLASTEGIEQSPCSLYLWFAGLNPTTDPPQEFSRFHVRDIDIPDETMVVLSLEDETLRLRQQVGTRVDRTSYPDADPDDVGKVIPMVFGSVSRLPALAIDAGMQTSLPNNINAAATSFALSDTTSWTVGKVFQLDSEQCYISGISGDTVTVTRGYNTTVPVIHLKGAIAWEIKDRFTYLVADHALDQIPKVRGRVGQAEVDVTAIASRYLGSGTFALVGAGVVGGQHPDYPGKACVTLPGYITVEQAVDLLISDGINVADAIAVVDTIAVSDTIGVSDSISVYDTINVSDTIGVSDGITVSQGNHAHTGSALSTVCPIDDIIAASGSWFIPADAAIDGNLNTGGIVENGASHADTRFKRTQPFSLSGTPIRYRWVWVTGDPVYSAPLKVGGSSVGGGTTKRTDYGVWFSISTWPSLTGKYIDVSGSGGRCRVWELWIEVEYSSGTSSTPATGVGKSGTVYKSGSASKSGSVSKLGSASKTGAANKTGGASKSGSVSKTGTVTLSGNSTANTLIGDAILCDVVRTSSIAQTFDTLLAFGGYGAVSVAGAFPAGYALNGVINANRPLIEWLDLLAFQCRAYFRMHLGQGRLIVRPDALTSIRTIPAVRLTNNHKAHARRKVAYSEVVNRINLLYARDWSDGGDNAYQSNAAVADSASIAVYGEQERPGLFQCDFITSEAMAESLAAFYLAQHKDRPWLHSFEVFLDHAALEFADAITLGFAGDQIGEIQQARFSPGDTTRMDVIELVVKV